MSNLEPVTNLSELILLLLDELGPIFSLIAGDLRLQLDLPLLELSHQTITVSH